jgi:alpha-glucoside transport system permease protein
MAAQPMSMTRQRRVSGLLINLILVLICLVWIIPAFGVFVTSFRPSEEIFRSGWWTVFPHQGMVETERIPREQLVEEANGEYRVPGLNTPASFETLRQGVEQDGRRYTWIGNRRAGWITVEEQRFLGFDTSLTNKNYSDVLTGADISFTDASGNTISRRGNDMSGAFLNSLAVAVPATIIPILIAAFAAYGFAWLNFPGRKLLFTIVVALLVVPLQIALIPILQDYTNLGLNGTFLAMWLAHTGFGLPLAIYLLFNYISSLPRDLLESAYIDGASNFTIFTRLILPLSVPALASFAIFQFLWVWNDYLVALVFLGDQNRVVTQALAAMVGEKGQDWHLLTAGAFVSMILPLTVFFALQRYFVRGLLAGSVKG